MVLTLAEHSDTSKQNEIYMMASRILGYDMAVQDRTTRMPGKLQFQILFIPFYILYLTFITLRKYNLLSSFHFIHCKCLVETLWWKAPRAVETCRSGA
jgi:hypothetical protein